MAIPIDGLLYQDNPYILGPSEIFSFTPIVSWGGGRAERQFRFLCQKPDLKFNKTAKIPETQAIAA